MSNSHRLSGPPTDLPSYIPPHNQPPPTTIREESNGGDVSPPAGRPSIVPSSAALPMSPWTLGTMSRGPSTAPSTTHRSLSSRIASFRRGSLHEDSRAPTPMRFPSILAPKPVRVRSDLPDVLAAGATSRPGTGAVPETQTARGVSVPPRDHSTNPPFPPQPPHATTPAFSPNSMKPEEDQNGSAKKRKGIAGWLASPPDAKRGCGGRFNFWKVVLLAILLAVVVIAILLGIILGAVVSKKKRGSSGGSNDIVGGATIPTFTSTSIALPTGQPDVFYDAAGCLSRDQPDFSTPLSQVWACNPPANGFTLNVKKADSGGPFDSAQPVPGSTYESGVQRNAWKASGSYLVSMDSRATKQNLTSASQIFSGWNGIQFSSQPMILLPQNPSATDDMADERRLRYNFTFSYSKQVIIPYSSGLESFQNQLKLLNVKDTLQAYWNTTIGDQRGILAPSSDGSQIQPGTLFFGCEWDQTDWTGILFADQSGSFTNVASRSRSTISKRQIGGGGGGGGGTSGGGGGGGGGGGDSGGGGGGGGGGGDLGSGGDQFQATLSTPVGRPAVVDPSTDIPTETFNNNNFAPTAAAGGENPVATVVAPMVSSLKNLGSALATPAPSGPAGSSGGSGNAQSFQPKLIFRETRPTNDELQENNPSSQGGSTVKRNPVTCTLYYLPSSGNALLASDALRNFLFLAKISTNPSDFVVNLSSEVIPSQGSNHNVSSRGDGHQGGCGCEFGYL